MLHLSGNSAGANEYVTGLGVGTEVAPTTPRNSERVWLDFPSGQRVQAWKNFRPELLWKMCDALPNRRFVGSGPRDALIKEGSRAGAATGEEDRRVALQRLRGIVPGCPESMGLRRWSAVTGA